MKINVLAKSARKSLFFFLGGWPGGPVGPGQVARQVPRQFVVYLPAISCQSPASRARQSCFMLPPTRPLIACKSPASCLPVVLHSLASRPPSPAPVAHQSPTSQPARCTQEYLSIYLSASPPKGSRSSGATSSLRSCVRH